MKPPFSIRFSRSFGEFLLFTVFAIFFSWESQARASYTVVSWSWGVTVAGYSFILFHSLIQDFSSKLWLGLHNVVKYSFEFFHSVIQDFSSRLWFGLLMASYPTNSFALTWCLSMSTSWLSKAMFTLYRIVKRSVTETEWYSVNRPRMLQCAAK